LTQFSQRNNVLNVSASNTNGFPWRDSCGYSTQLNRSIWNKESLLHMENLRCRKYIFQKRTQFLQGNNVLDAPVSNTNSFLSRDTCVPSTQLNRPISNKESLSSPGIT
jgi:hypothetical protein